MRLIKILLCLLLVGGGLLEANYDEDIGNTIDAFVSKIVGLEQLSEFIGTPNNQSSFINRLNRLLYTFGLCSLNADNYMFDGIDYMIQDTIAKNFYAGGESPTEYDIQRAKVFSAAGKSNEALRNSLIAPYEAIVKEAQWDIYRLEKKRYSKQTIEAMKKELLPYKKASEYLNNAIKKPSNFDYDEWASITNISIPNNNDDNKIIFVK